MVYFKYIEGSCDARIIKQIHIGPTAFYGVMYTHNFHIRIIIYLVHVTMHVYTHYTHSGCLVEYYTCLIM